MTFILKVILRKLQQSDAGKMTTEPNIFEYIDFRKFLTDWRESEKNKNPGLTHEYLSTKLGQKKNRAYFKDLEKGRRMVGPGVLERLIKLIGLDSDEGKYLRAIVGYGQPTTYEEREFWFEQAIQLNHTPKKFVDQKTYTFYKKWYHTTIRAFLETCDFDGDYTAVAKKLYNRVSPKEIREAIANLKALKLIAPDDRGFLKPTDKVLSTGDVVKDELLRQYHVANHDILRTILLKDETGSHNSTQMTFSVSKEGMDRIIKRIQQLRREIISIVHKDENKADRVYKVALHAYPESRKD
jgi:uncharacterized protein (TIGR02147 family)